MYTARFTQRYVVIRLMHSNKEKENSKKLKFLG